MNTRERMKQRAWQGYAAEMFDRQYKEQFQLAMMNAKEQLLQQINNGEKLHVTLNLGEVFN